MKKTKETKTKAKSTKKETKLELEEFEELDEQEESLLSALKDEAYDVEDEYDETDEEKDFEYIVEEDDEEEAVKTKPKKKRTTKKQNNSMNYKLLINICFVAIMIILLVIAIDVIAVARYGTGPFFAIQTKVYKDGGTKVFHGFGYKVIKYNQLEGRKGMTVGLWNMKYSTEPTPIDILDLALEFEKDKTKTSNKFYNQYLKVTGTIREVDIAKQQLIMEYNDVDGKYTLEVIANLTDEVIISSITASDKVEVYGVAKKFSAKTEKEPNKITLEGCFVKKSEE